MSLMKYRTIEGVEEGKADEKLMEGTKLRYNDFFIYLGVHIEQLLSTLKRYSTYSGKA